MKTTVTFLGGPIDLQRVMLSEVPPTYDVVALPEMRVYGRVTDKPRPGEMYLRARYRRILLDGSAEVVYLYQYTK